MPDRKQNPENRDEQEGTGDPAADRGDPANNAGASRTSESGGRVVVTNEVGNRVVTDGK